MSSREDAPAARDSAATRLIQELSVALNDAREMLEHSQDAIMVLDDDRRYLALNRAAAELLERAPHEVLGRTLEEVFELDADARTVFDDAWQLLQARGSLRIDWPMVLPGGSQVVLDVAATASYRPGRHLSIMRDVTANRRDQEELADREQRLRFLLDEIERLRDDERQRMAVDIHDQSLQHLLAARMTLDLAATLDGDARADADSRAGELLDDAIASTRRLLQGLAPLHTEHRTIGDTLTLVLRELAELHDVRIAVDLDLPLQLTNARRVVLSRIVTEAVLNACRHAGAREIRVRGRVDATGLTTLCIADDGDGFDPSNIDADQAGRTGVGMQLMRERVRSLSGAVDIRSSLDRGTTVVLEIPDLTTDDAATAEP